MPRFSFFAVPSRYFASAAASALLLALLGSTSTRSSVAAPRVTLPLALERHFPELATLEPDGSARLAELRRQERERYLHALPFGPQIRSAARRHRLDSLLLASVVEAESSFRPDAVSPKGALGLMQLMPFHFDLGQEPFDPSVNLAVGAEYLAQLERRYGGDLELALAAYHAGPGTIDRFGGLPPYRETRIYVGRVLELYREHQSSVAARVLGELPAGDVGADQRLF